MTLKITAVERAIELARSGSCNTVGEIKQQLTQEGLSVEQIEDHAIARQLRDLIATADRTARPFRRD